MKHIIWVLLVFVGMSYASAQDVYTSSGKPGYHKKAKKKKAAKKKCQELINQQVQESGSTIMGRT